VSEIIPQEDSPRSSGRSRRILLINHYAGSPDHGMEYRPFYFGREWVRAGHRVLIVAASFSHLRRVNPSVPGTVMQETMEGVQYLWVTTPPYLGNGSARVRNMATFMFRLWRECSRPIAAFRPDLVIASSTYTWDNWLAARYAKACNARYVYEVHDLWPLTPMELAGMSRWHPFIWSLQRAEDFACRHADMVVSLLPAAKSHLVAHGMPPERFVYIPNGVVPEEWEIQKELPSGHAGALGSIRSGARFMVGYVGGHGLSNALDALIEAGADDRMKDVAFVCVGDGPEKERLRKKAQTLGGNVHFLGPVPKRAIPELLRAFDALYIGWARSPLYRFGISPNKLFEYMMAGVPILHAVEAANDPVRDAGCGLSILPENVSALCEGIRALARLSPEERRSMGAQGRHYVETHHELRTLAKRFLDCVWDSGSAATVPAAAGTSTTAPV
jgi:glycosyltransferase involved in cell wall biosynthesis